MHLVAGFPIYLDETDIFYIMHEVVHKCLKRLENRDF